MIFRFYLWTSVGAVKEYTFLFSYLFPTLSSPSNTSFMLRCGLPEQHFDVPNVIYDQSKSNKSPFTLYLSKGVPFELRLIIERWVRIWSEISSALGIRKRGYWSHLVDLLWVGEKGIVRYRNKRVFIAPTRKKWYYKVMVGEHFDARCRLRFIASSVVPTRASCVVYVRLYACL